MHEVHRSLVVHREARAREALARPVARIHTGVCSVAHRHVRVVTSIDLDAQARAAVTSTGGRGACLGKNKK